MTVNIESVVVPEDDDPKKVLMTIEKIRKTREGHLLQIAEYLRINTSSKNCFMRVISFCHRQTEFFWYLTKSNTNLEKENLEECIKLMEQVTDNPHHLMQMQTLAYDIGIEYRNYRVELEVG